MPSTPTDAKRPLDGVEIVERVPAFRGHFRVDRYVLRHRRFDGTWTPPLIREVFERGHAAAVLLYDPARDLVALTEQFRPGALAAGWNPWLIEIVAGVIDRGESPEATAMREAREEAGVEITELVSMPHLIATPGGSSETVQLFCARVDASRIGGIHGMEQEGEDIRVFTLPASEALAWVEDGRIRNAITVVAVQWLALHRDELLKRWG